MKFMFACLFLLGLGYMWFATYQPSPSSNTMGGAIESFQKSIVARDVNGMRRVCAPSAQDQCQRILDDIRTTEDQLDETMETVGSFGFDYPRQRKDVDGVISGQTEDGGGVFSANVRVTDQGGNWLITNIQ